MDPAAAPFADLVAESHDEAVFLLRRWESELASLTRSLDEVWSWTEDRLQGTLEGVRLAGAGLVDMVTPGLLSDETDQVAVCAGLLSSCTDRDALGALSAALATAEGARLTSMLRGIELMASRDGVTAATRALMARDTNGAGAVCRLLSFHRIVTPEHVAAAWRAGAPGDHVEAMRAARHLPARDAEAWITRGMDGDEPSVRAAAVSSGVARGVREAWARTGAVARALTPDAAPYLPLVAIFGRAEDHEAVYAALRVPSLQSPAIWALGHVGTSRAAEACLAGMRHPALARACGEAYCWITGAELERDRLAAPDATPDAPPFEADDLDADLVPSPEALWPLPDVEAVQRHWAARREELTPDVRHVRGRPVTTDALLAGVESGPMLRRPDLVFELGARTRGGYDVEVRAFAARQRRMMAAGRAAGAGQTGR